VAAQTSSLAGDRQVLTGAAAHDAVHHAAPRSSVEGAHIVPDRSFCQGRFFHPGHEDGCCVGFPFNVTQSVRSGGGVYGKVKSAVAREEAEAPSWQHEGW
jgi:hypothetical protein